MLMGHAPVFTNEVKKAVADALDNAGAQGVFRTDRREHRVNMLRQVHAHTATGGQSAGVDYAITLDNFVARYGDYYEAKERLKRMAQFIILDIQGENAPVVERREVQRGPTQRGVRTRSRRGASRKDRARRGHSCRAA